MSREAHVRICESVRVKFPRATRPLWVLIDLGFGFSTRQHVRLRGLDAPEVESAEGKEAKTFLERQLKDSVEIIVTTTKSDKYDRYLADVFYTVDGKERFLNNRLLEAGLAERVQAT